MPHIPFDQVAPDLGILEFLESEIARLEEELRLRDEADRAPAPGPDAESDSARTELIRSYQAEIAERDEMIEVLQEHVRVLEEARAADRQEWEQIGNWVEQLEAQAVALKAPSRDAARSDQEGAWVAERSALRTEIAQLQARLSEQATATAGAEVDALRRALHTAQSEVERLRHDTAKSAAADAATEQTNATLDSVGPRAALTPNERLRALRLHLNEIQQREEQERRERSFSARLSRIWNRNS